MIDNLFLLFRQIPEGHIRPYPHLPADISHQRPHETVPRSNSSIVNADRIIRHQRIQIYCADTSGTTTFRAGTLGIKRQFFRTGCMNSLSALRAENVLFRRHI